ncbi:DNA polymerase domain-containing protein [Janibacter anophelis]|uniref:DNA polymerase domain-containing protein n=1 Tax=Janibacter anophelis TaxID=319054 RepID=UPI000AD5599C
MAKEHGEDVHLDVGGRDVRISSPERVYFPERGETKLDLAQYYLAVGDGILRALRERPTMLHRFPKGVEGAKVHQKRLPKGAPDWVETVRLHFPRYDLHADELCPTELAQIIWAVQMSTVEMHPWNVRRADVDRPDEWRIDLDPMPDAPFDRVRRVAGVCREVLDELGIVGFPKTSGGGGLHVYVRIEPRWEFGDVRRAALLLPSLHPPAREGGAAGADPRGIRRHLQRRQHPLTHPHRPRAAAPDRVSFRPGGVRHPP